MVRNQPFSLYLLLTMLHMAACSVTSELNQEARSHNEATLSDSDTTDSDAATPTTTTNTPPVPSGCITSTATGLNQYNCMGLTVHAKIPAACQAAGCGLILEIHGDTGTGPLMDANTDLFKLGNDNGYIVIAPTGPPYGGGLPGSTWSQAEDSKLIAITQLFASVFRVNDKKIHATGFSRGGFVTWRLLCDASNLFASVAPAAAGNGNGEVTCFSGGKAPQRQADVLFMMGLTDAPVPFPTMVSIRDAAVANYTSGPKTVISSDANYTHNQWTNAQGVHIETFEHAYETSPTGTAASSKGHCFPGSKLDPNAPQYAVACAGPNSFTWGEEVMKFFKNHPKK